MNIIQASSAAIERSKDTLRTQGFVERDGGGWVSPLGTVATIVPQMVSLPVDYGVKESAMIDYQTPPKPVGNGGGSR